MNALNDDPRYTALRRHFFAHLDNDHRAQVFVELGIPQQAMRFAMLKTMQPLLFDELYRTREVDEIGDAMMAVLRQSQAGTAAAA